MSSDDNAKLVDDGMEHAGVGAGPGLMFNLGTKRYSVLFSCSVCGAADGKAGVPYRKPEQDVVAYMNDVVMPAVAAAHQARAPRCLGKTVTLKIPRTNDAGVGLAPPAGGPT